MELKHIENIVEQISKMEEEISSLKNTIIEFDEKLKKCNKNHSEWDEFKAKKRKVFTKLSRHVY